MVQLLKVHGSLNAFFILDQTKLVAPLNDKELVTFTQKITNPQNGILNGADGVLVVDKPTRPGAVAQMRVINADGSEASMCGNGLRTVARYIANRDRLTNFKIDTMNASLRVRQHDNLAPGVPAFAVEISPIKFENTALPYENLGCQRMIDKFVPELLPGLRFTSIAVPNPHLISFVSKEELASNDLGELGKRLNNKNPYFTDGVNVNFAHIRGRNSLFVRTFERGVGFTNACGTGMSATSLAFVLTHPNQATLNEPINVYNPGGMVQTIVHHQHGQYWIELIGNATITHTFEISEDDLHHAKISQAKKITNTGEEKNYEHFVATLPRISF